MMSACLYWRRSRRVLAEPARSAAAHTLPATASFCDGGSGTRRNSGMENSPHQAATLTNDSRVATPASGMPNHSGF